MAEIMGQGFLRTTNKKGGFLQEDVLNYVDELNGKIDELEKKLSEINTNAPASNQNAVDNAVVEKLQDELTKALNQLEQEKQKRTEEQKSFEEEKANLLKEVQTVSNSNNGDNTELLEQLSEKDETIASQSSKIQQAFLILEENKTHLEELMAEIEQKESEIASQKAVIQSKEGVIEEKSNQIFALNNEISELKTRLAESGQSSATDMLGMIATITKTAQAEADKLKNDSETKAKEVIEEANAKAQEILGMANAEAQAIKDDNNKKSEDLNVLSTTIKNMLKTQIQTISENIIAICDSVNEAQSSLDKAEECIEDDQKLKEILPEYTPTINIEENILHNIVNDSLNNNDDILIDEKETQIPVAESIPETVDEAVENEETTDEEPKPIGKVWGMDDLAATSTQELPTPDKNIGKPKNKWGMSDLDDLLKEVEASAPVEEDKHDATKSSISDDWGIDIEALTKAVEDDAQINGDYNG